MAATFLTSDVSPYVINDHNIRNVQLRTARDSFRTLQKPHYQKGPTGYGENDITKQVKSLEKEKKNTSENFREGSSHQAQLF